MTDGLVVRRARLDDLKVIVELRLALLREYGDHPLYANLRSDAEERAVDLFRAQLIAPNECMFLAERRGRVIGVLRCVESTITPLLYPDRYVYVSSVYVRPPERRQGVLHALVAAAEAWSDERGITEMRLHSAASSADAVAAWDALGFEIVEHVRRRTVPSARTHAVRHSHGDSQLRAR